MKDRLEELRMRVKEAGDSCDMDDILAFDNPVFSEEEANPISKVFQEGSNLSLALDKLEELSESIDKKQQKVLCCTTEESIYEEKKGLSNMKASFTNEAKVIQPQLSAIQDRLVRDSRPWCAGHRIRQNQLSLLVRRYRDILNRHYAKETLYVGKLKEQITRQAELAGLSLGEKDVDELVESPVAPRIVGRDLEVLKAKQHLAMAQVRHQQLLDLEAQITELHSLFLHLEVLVSEQTGEDGRCPQQAPLGAPRALLRFHFCKTRWAAQFGRHLPLSMSALSLCHMQVLFDVKSCSSTLPVRSVSPEQTFQLTGWFDTRWWLFLSEEIADEASSWS
uniref:Syntaxin N-terminal domain-containing protein n=1 Tax=Apteryx owenii TaxID=8824 RepID=A0A8B9PWS2_APTOW